MGLLVGWSDFFSFFLDGLVREEDKQSGRGEESTSTGQTVSPAPLAAWMFGSLHAKAQDSKSGQAQQRTADRTRSRRGGKISHARVDERIRPRPSTPCRHQPPFNNTGAPQNKDSCSRPHTSSAGLDLAFHYSLRVLLSLGKSPSRCSPPLSGCQDTTCGDRGNIHAAECIPNT